MKIKAAIFRKDANRCRECGNILTKSEKEYYGATCEKCERKSIKKCEQLDSYNRRTSKNFYICIVIWLVEIVSFALVSSSLPENMIYPFGFAAGNVCLLTLMSAKNMYQRKAFVSEWLDEEMDEEELYVCDPAKNKECPKTNCYLNGGDCARTFNAEFRRDL